MKRLSLCLENRESVYDNLTTTASSSSLKRQSPTPPKTESRSKRKKADPIRSMDGQTRSDHDKNEKNKKQSMAICQKEKCTRKRDISPKKKI